MYVVVTVGDSGLCCIDKKLKQNDFQNLNVNFKERLQNDENLRLDSENCFSSYLLLFFLLLLFFSIPLLTPDEDLRSKALVFFIFFMCKVSTFLWNCSVLSTSPAVIDSFRQKSVLR